MALYSGINLNNSLVTDLNLNMEAVNINVILQGVLT